MSNYEGGTSFVIFRPSLWQSAKTCATREHPHPVYLYNNFNKHHSFKYISALCPSPRQPASSLKVLSHKI